MNKPIGCFGGTFNPPHKAHFALAHAAQQQLQLAQVLLIPTGQPWQKPHVLPAHHRVNMLRAAIQDDCTIWRTSHPSVDYPIALDTIESDLAEPSYTITTLKALRLRHPKTPLVWIMGSDQLKNLSTWKDWTALLHYAHIAVAQRAGHHFDAAELTEPLRQFFTAQLAQPQTQWQKQLCGRFVMFTLDDMLISSSAIRQAIHDGQSAQHIDAIHPAVADYITIHHFYQDTL